MGKKNKTENTFFAIVFLLYSIYKFYNSEDVFDYKKHYLDYFIFVLSIFFIVKYLLQRKLIEK